MPELPEVAALVRLLTEHTAGRVVKGVQLASVAALKTFEPPYGALTGATIVTWHRRGKYLCMESTGPWLVIHLARGGWARLWDLPPQGKVKLSSRSPLAWRMELDDGSGLDLTEMGTEKRLALWVVRDPMEVEGLATLGPEPLGPSFDAVAMSAVLRGEKGTVKSALSRQSAVAGIGNAYSDEILHAAQMSPYKAVRSLSDEDIQRLYGAMQEVLAQAMDRAARVSAAELKPEKKRTMRVHGRTGEPCPVCGDTVREVSFATRSLQYCATCQTGGKPLADRRLSRLLK